MINALLDESAHQFQLMQQTICSDLEAIDETGKFHTDTWKRQDLSGHEGGGGITRVLTDGSVFEKAGVNFSRVHGTLPPEMSEKLIGEQTALPFEAVGTSLVIHPLSPMVPTIHANVRCLKVKDRSWYGGGIDLTPYVLFREDGKSFHTGLKEVCDRHSKDFYPKFKTWCDEYFFIKHRNETRGIGGIFFDYLGKDQENGLLSYRDFVFDIARSFSNLYIPIVKRRMGLSFTDEQKRFQLLRRGRYVEFNLVYDRGTLFGLKTEGRTESILMSLPKHASWEYDYTPPSESPEAELVSIFKKPIEWV